MSEQFRIVKTAFLSLLLALAVCNTGLLAQYNTASLGGSVVDPSGASVPGAVVKVENKDTGFTKDMTTGNDGSFLFPSLSVGNYRLTVEKSGFSTYVQDGLTLAVNQAASQSVVLQVGKTAEEITISANADLVTTREATVGQIVDQRRIVDLPLNGRGAQSLVFLSAGTVDVSDRYCGLNCEGGIYPGQQQAAVSGAGPGEVNYQMDGAGHNDTYINANLPFPNPDAIQEFNLQSDNLSAIYGNAAGVVNIVTKSGTNQLHGDVFEFLRNGALNARNFFAADQDSLKRNQYGGSVGGPIQKDKLFFFATYQGTRIRSAPGGQIAFVPTVAERSGDFSALLPDVQLVDPRTNVPFAGNQVPVSPVTQYFLQSIPAPNGSGRQLTYVGGATLQNEDQFMTKFDYTRGKHQISGRYFHTYFRQPVVISKTNLLLDTNVGNHVRVQTVSLNESFSASPSLLFNTWFGWQAQTGGSLTSAPFGFPDAGVNIAKGPLGNEMRLSVGDNFDIDTGHNGDFDRLGWTLRENVTLTRGAHEWQFGGEAVHLKVDVRNAYRQSGRFRFRENQTGDNMADFVLGLAQRFQQGGGEFMLLNGVKWTLFAQDNWRVNPRLTLNLGLRWDPYFPFTEERGHLACFVPGAQSLRFPKAPPGMIFGGVHHDTGCPQNGSYPTASNFAPRLGFAYRLTEDGKTSLRGGAGFYYAPPATAGYTNFVDTAPFSPQFSFEKVIDFADPFGSAGVTNPFPAKFLPSFVAGPDSTFELPQEIVLAFQPDYKLPLLATWNLTVERQVAHDWLLRAAYAGNKGTHLYGGDFKGYTQANPGVPPLGLRLSSSFDSVAVLGSFDNSNYHALQLGVEKRFGHGFSMLANYTWSKTLDDFGTEGAGPTDPFSRHFDRGRSDDDVAHIFRFSNIWQLPSVHRSGAAGKVLNGWELNSIWVWRGGFPFTVFCGCDNAFSGQGLDRADFIRPGNAQLSSGRSHGEMVNEFFDTSLFGPNVEGTFGNSGKNILRGPKSFNLDFGLLKKTNLTERTSLQFRAEFFNLFNNVNFGQPDHSFGDGPGSFGVITSAADPRIIQFALKILF